MVGNSLKSDILPVLEIGGEGAYVPYKITWEHEKIDLTDYSNFLKLFWNFLTSSSRYI